MKKKKFKYAYQRVEQRKTNNHNKQGLKECAQFKKQTQQKISIGTFTFLKPKPNSKIREFTLAFSKPLTKREVYLYLAEAFNVNLLEDTTKSVFVKLKSPILLRELRTRLRENFDELLE